MADLTNIKLQPSATWPPKGKESAWLRLEPLLTPIGLKQNYLFGLPLVSAIPDPITHRYEMMDDTLLQSYIKRAVSVVELETKLTLFSTEFNERKEFDRNEWNSFGYFKLINKPVWGIVNLTIQTPDGQDVFTVPTQWMEGGYLYRGQLNIQPFVIGTTSNSGAVLPGATGTGIHFLNIFGAWPWVPAWWAIDYIAGFPDDLMPTIINELIGCVAAIDILSTLATTYAKSHGASLSIDGLSQSVSTPGPELFKVRLGDLQEKRQLLVGRIKAIFGQKIHVSNV